MFRRIQSLVRELSLALTVLVATVSLLSTFGPSDAWADDDWSDEDEAAFDDDDEFSDEYEDEFSDEEEEEDYDQPERWAGGLYTKRTWPQSFVERNLILIGGMAQFRGGLDIDISDRTAFDVWRAVAELRYGILDNFEVQAGANAVLVGDIAPTTASGAYNALFFMGFESAIAYELVDFRLTTELLYTAETETLDSDVAFNIAFGFPFRYRFNKKVAIYALEKLMTIETDGSDPDFTLGLSAAFQAVKELAIIGGVQVDVEDFNFKDNAVRIPARLGVLFAPKNNVDLGLQFTFLNLKPPEVEGLEDDEQPQFYDQRSILLYAQLRL